MIDPKRFTILRLPRALRREIEYRAMNTYPREECGVLIGRSDGGWIEVSQVCAARNLAREAARFELDPGDLVKAQDCAHSLGMDVVGIWHSHPDQIAEPSHLDRQAAQPNWSYLIVEVDQAGSAKLRSWRLDEGEFCEEELRA